MYNVYMRYILEAQKDASASEGDCLNATTIFYIHSCNRLQDCVTKLK